MSKIDDAKANIRVVARFRPMQQREYDKHSSSCVNFIDKNTLKIRSVIIIYWNILKYNRRRKMVGIREKSTHFLMIEFLIQVQPKKRYMSLRQSQQFCQYQTVSMEQFLHMDKHLQERLTLCKAKISMMKYYLKDEIFQNRMGITPRIISEIFQHIYWKYQPYRLDKTGETE